MYHFGLNTTLFKVSCTVCAQHKAHILGQLQSQSEITVRWSVLVFCIIAAANEVMLSDQFVYISVSRLSEKLGNKFSMTFGGRFGH